MEKPDSEMNEDQLAFVTQMFKRIGIVIFIFVALTLMRACGAFDRGSDISTVSVSRESAHPLLKEFSMWSLQEKRRNLNQWLEKIDAVIKDPQQEKSTKIDICQYVMDLYYSNHLLDSERALKYNFIEAALWTDAQSKAFRTFHGIQIATQDLEKEKDPQRLKERVDNLLPYFKTTATWARNIPSFNPNEGARRITVFWAPLINTKIRPGREFYQRLTEKNLIY
ncbi:MAG: hypothetical protein ACAI35_23610 [Candidatus Methylacidiphilales bacterium]